jgi:hypothetical protein
MVMPPKVSSSFRSGNKSLPRELLELLPVIPFHPAELVNEGAVFHVRQFFQTTAENLGFMAGQ